MPTHTTRRHLLKRAAAAAGALALPAIASGRVLGANERLNVAGIGVGGKGRSDISCCDGENVVALCDVDQQRAAASFERFPKAKRYTDFRRMLEREGKHIDAVTVSTPDHVHAHAAIMAMNMGKHVYCQKPLAHSIHEARLMRQTAARTGVATQMGNQGHSRARTRRLVELIRGGALGTVHEVHVWTDRPIWPQGIGRPAATPPVPGHLDWDLWLGPAPARPYHPAYVPFKWRGWWDFGTGALGDMGCHLMDLPFWALGLRDPLSIEARSSGGNDQTAPNWSVIDYAFGPRGTQPAVKFTWYDGGRKPPATLINEPLREAKNGVILVGDKDTAYVSRHWGGARFVSGARLEDFKDIPQVLPRGSGADKEENIDRLNHLEWIAACKGGAPALSNFDNAGPLTESVLLGNVALRAGQKIEWDAKNLKVTNVADANQYVRRAYRKGWELGG